jgi:hypothetical protein
MGILQYFGGYLGRAPDNQSVEIPDNASEFFRSERCIYFHFETWDFHKLFDPRIGKVVANKNLH